MDVVNKQLIRADGCFKKNTTMFGYLTAELVKQKQLTHNQQVNNLVNIGTLVGKRYERMEPWLRLYVREIWPGRGSDVLCQ